MKRQIAYLCLFAALLGLTTSTACRAQNEDPFSLFPESCAIEARLQYKEDLKNPDHHASHAYDDGRSSVARAIRALDDKLSRAVFDIQTLQSVGEAYDPPNRIPRRQKKAAEHIFDDLPPGDFISTQVSISSPNQVPDSEIHYTCRTDSCPLGAECLFEDLGNAQEQLRQDLPMNRRIMERILNWAKPIGSLRVRAIRLEREYEKFERELRQMIEELPPQLVTVTVRVPVRVHRVPPQVVVVEDINRNPEVTTSEPLH